MLSARVAYKLPAEARNKNFSSNTCGCYMLRKVRLYSEVKVYLLQNSQLHPIQGRELHQNRLLLDTKTRSTWGTLSPNNLLLFLRRPPLLTHENEHTFVSDRYKVTPETVVTNLQC
jgi:hypothetical protein